MERGFALPYKSDLIPLNDRVAIFFCLLNERMNFHNLLVDVMQQGRPYMIYQDSLFRWAGRPCY
jgi:hypothetical protein